MKYLDSFLAATFVISVSAASPLVAADFKFKFANVDAPQSVGGHRAVVSTVKGRSTLIGFAKWYLDPMDKNGRGYVVGAV